MHVQFRLRAFSERHRTEPGATGGAKLDCERLLRDLLKRLAQLAVPLHLAFVSAACGGSSSTALAGSNVAGGGMAGASAGSAGAGGANAGAGGANAGSAGSLGGTSSEGGSSSGGSSGGHTCSDNKTEVACKAAAHCYPLYVILPCPGSSAACPTVFSSCANTGCGPTCGVGSVCVGQSSEGGAVELPDDAGACPQGSHLTGQVCQADVVETFACKPTPAACGDAISCACAGSACSGTCQSAEYNQIDCVQYVP